MGYQPEELGGCGREGGSRRAMEKLSRNACDIGKTEREESMKNRDPSARKQPIASHSKNRRRCSVQIGMYAGRGVVEHGLRRIQR